MRLSPSPWLCPPESHRSPLSRLLLWRFFRQRKRQKPFLRQPKPRLIASRPDPVGNVAVIMADILEPGRGKVEIADVFAAYAEACEASGKRPIPANEFPAAIAALCQRMGIEIEDNAKGVFLLKVRLKKGNENEGTFHPEVSNHDGA